jgi:peptidoglycan/LPS O-acetylase OafA/YrhL
MTPFITAGAGFLLAVLWFDLMFDVQAGRHPTHRVPEEVLDSIATYYRRVTTTARPMNRLVALVMLGTLGSIIAQIARGDHPHWLGWVSLVLAAVPIVLAGAHTVPSAVRLGSRRDPIPRQQELAKAILRDHLVCALGILALLVLQLAEG